MGFFGKRKAPDGATPRAAHTPAYLAPYQEAVDEAGATFESLLWRNKAFQRIRFDALTDTGLVKDRIVADLGCGRADLLARWIERRVPYAGYVGVEGIPELASFCRDRLEREKQPNAAIEEADFAADRRLFERLIREHGVSVLLFSGSLNTFTQKAATDLLDRAWQSLARHAEANPNAPAKTLVFNFLSSYAAKEGEDLGPAHRFDTQAMLRWALDRTPRVRFRHDYLEGRDATIAMDTPGERWAE